MSEDNILSKYKIPLFNGANHKEWSTKMALALQIKLMWKYCDPKLLTKVMGSSSSTKKDNPEEHMKCHALLLLSMDAHTTHTTHTHHTPHTHTIHHTHTPHIYTHTHSYMLTHTHTCSHTHSYTHTHIENRSRTLRIQRRSGTRQQRFIRGHQQQRS
jgi:hypothetical protein